ncbi:tRNA lysidine(34) synthetase TilS [Marinimicrobium sp. C6131]|nr:tRNA lysidine(34) synthetase TilS [Marinimicrobium sp. C6131]
MPLIESIQTLPEDRRYCVALSGGLDSTVLLHAVASGYSGVRAVHVHHGLSPNADQWQRHCETLCEQLGVPLDVVTVDVQKDGKGLEDAAREARYQAFTQQLQRNEILLTAHHGDDQVETLLMRLARGSGIRGLAGMASRRPLGAGELWRPLLGVSRSELETYAQSHGLSWVEDESNEDLQFDRNFLRHRVIPALRERWPHLAESWGQSAALCAESEALLDEYAREDLARLAPEFADPHASVDRVLSLPGLRGLSPARRHQVLRVWFRERGVPGLNRDRLTEVDRQLVDGREDAQARVAWDGWELRRFREGLYLLSSASIEAPVPSGRIPLQLCEEGRVPLPGGAVLAFEKGEQGASGSRLASGLPDLSIQWRRGGERCQPEGRAHSQTLKRLLQEYALAPWWRARLPLIYSGETLVAAGDLWVCKGFSAAPGQPGYRLRWYNF